MDASHSAIVKGFPNVPGNKANLHYPASVNLVSLVSVKAIPQYQCTLFIGKSV
jgi:hypothetical protein